MKKFLLVVMSLNLLFINNTWANETHISHAEELAAVKRAADENIEKLLNEIRHLKSDKMAQSFFGVENLVPQLFTLRGPDSRRCDEDRVRCVRNCVSRYSDGSCSRYAQDFCGPDATCAPNCVSRYSDGSCSRYAQDFCGPDASCSSKCESRYSDGSCARYGSDICG